MANTVATPKIVYSGAPIAGPMTRERFIWTDCNDTAPGRSSLGTSVGRIAPIAGAFNVFATPIASTHTKMAPFDGWSTTTSAASPKDSSICSTCITTR